MSDSITIRIQGMTCGHCVAAVERAVRGTPGVGEISVQVGRAKVAIPATADRDRVIASVLDAIEQAGYSASVDEPVALHAASGAGCCCSTGRASATSTLAGGAA